MSTLSVMEFDLPMNPYAADDDVERYAEPVLEPPGGERHQTLTNKLRRKYPTWPAGDHPMVAHHIQQVENLAKMPHHPDAKAQAADYFQSLQSKDHPSPVGVHHLAAVANHLGVQVPRSATAGRKRAVLQAIGDHINKGMASAYEQGDDTWKHLAAYKGTPGLNAWLHVPTGQDFMVYNYERPVGKQGWMNFGSSHEKGTPRWVHGQTGEFKDQANDPGIPEPEKAPAHIEHLRRMMGQMAESYDGSHPASVKQAQSLLEMAQHPDMRDHLFGTDEHSALQDKVKAAVQTPATDVPPVSATSAPASEPLTVHGLLQPNMETPETPIESPPAVPAPTQDAGLGDLSNVGIAADVPPAPAEQRERRMTGKRWNDIDLDAMQEMINAGRPVSEMVDRFDRNEKSIKQRMRMLNKNPRPTTDTVGIPKDIKIADSPGRTPPPETVEPPANPGAPPKMSDPMDKRLDHAASLDTNTDKRPTLYSLINHLYGKGYAPRGFTVSSEGEALSFDSSDKAWDGKGNVPGKLRRQILGALTDMSMMLHLPEVHADEGVRNHARDMASKIASFMKQESGAKIDDVELTVLTDRVYNRFRTNPTLDSLRITPDDIAHVKHVFSPAEIAKRMEQR